VEFWNFGKKKIQTTEKGVILKKIKKLAFEPGSELSGTFFPRKETWEAVQVLKKMGKWRGGSENDWMKQQKIMEENLSILAEAGFKSLRLVLMPDELIGEEGVYNWKPVEKILDLMVKYRIRADWCTGPIDYPYNPGIRLPKEVKNILKQEVKETGRNQIKISMGVDRWLPKSSEVIREFGLNFFEAFLKRYGMDKRIGKFYIGNEWPDLHGIEGTKVMANISKDFMEELIKRGLKLTDKKIALNTNIHPSNLRRLRKTFNPLFEILGDRGVLGIDTYPTREGKIREMIYKRSVERVKREFWKQEIELTEYQAELYDDDISGKSWAEIMEKYKKRVVEFYQEVFFKKLETYAVAGQIKRVGMWGIPLLLTAKRMGYDFPLEMMKTISETMAKRGGKDK